jgi:methylphosphotriester-DNA--protein-cysteine methyltransferase
VDGRDIPVLKSLGRTAAGRGGQEDRVRQVTVALHEMVVEGQSVDVRVLKAVESIERAHGMVTIEQLADDVAITTRHLQRQFVRYVGISPKLLARIRRFQRVFAARRNNPEGWASVAIGCGYADQAHLIRDFTELGGGAPAGLLSDLPEFTRQFTALRA